MKINLIGAGIAGATLAYELGKRGHELTIFEANKPGRATSAAAGIICPWITQRRNKKWYELAKGGAHYYPELAQALAHYGETDIGYAQNGAIKLHTSQEKNEKFYNIGLEKRQEAPEIGALRMLTPEAVTEKLPFIETDYYGLWIEGGGRVDGEALRQALLNVAVNQFKAKIRFKQAQINHAGVCVVDQTPVPADLTILANGVWMPDTGAEDIVPPIYFQKGELLHLKLKDMTDKLPVAMLPDDSYMLPFADGQIVVGVTREDVETLDDIQFSAAAMYDLLDKTFRIAPAFKTASIQDSRVGFRPFTNGFLPHFEYLNTAEKLFYLNGLGSSGLTMAPFIAQQIAKSLSGETPDITLKDYQATT